MENNSKPLKEFPRYPIHHVAEANLKTHRRCIQYGIQKKIYLDQIDNFKLSQKNNSKI